jgi:hypothetical protein
MGSAADRGSVFLEANGPDFYPTLTREKRFASMLLNNTISALGPLIVLLQTAQLGQGWRRLSFSFLGVSIVCFVARLALSEFREVNNQGEAVG